MTLFSRLGFDLAPLRRSKSFRRLYVYGAVSRLGAQAAYIALYLQLTNLTHSGWKVGLLGAAEIVPMVVFALFGGVIADHFNRQRIAIAGEVGMLLTMGALLFNSRLHHPSVVAIYLIAAAIAAVNGAQSPSLSALEQQLVPHDLQRQSATLRMAAGTGAAILGPILGGFLANYFGVSLVYLIDLISFAVTFSCLFGLAVVHTGRSDGEEPGVASVVIGAKYAAQRHDILGTYIVDLVAMIFAFPVATFTFGAKHFHSKAALPLFFAAIPFGSFLTMVTSKWTGRVHRYGVAISVAATVWGLGIVLFGATHSLVLALVGLTIAGIGDGVSGIFRQTMWNESIPPSVRGRMASIEMLSYSVGPTTAQLRAGTMVSVVGFRAANVIGGIACSGICALSPAMLRAMWNFDSRTNEHVREVATLRAKESEASTN